MIRGSWPRDSRFMTLTRDPQAKKDQDHPCKTALRMFLRAFWQFFSVFDDLDHAELFRISISAGQKLVSYRLPLREGSKRAKNRRKTKIIAKSTRNNCATHSEGTLRPVQSAARLCHARYDRRHGYPRPARCLRSHTALSAIASLHASQSRCARIARRLDRAAATSRSTQVTAATHRRLPHVCVPQNNKGGSAN